ncbi:MAG: Omp28-related outer membrane protein [Methanomassiliicoccales archaeon]|nr:MAG: Omp28-related outer membrane protein [Methanomassiliicoccales archaeon]
MNENSKFSKMLALLTGIIILFSVLGALPLSDIYFEPARPLETEFVEEGILNDESEMPLMRGTRQGSPRAVLVEMFTNWACGPCANAVPAINDLMDVYDPSEAVFILYHGNYPDPFDPFHTYNKPEEDEREAYYKGDESQMAYPTVYFDGLNEQSGAYLDPKINYDIYKSLIDDRLTEPSPLNITVVGDIIGSTGYVDVNIEATEDLSGFFKVRLAVVEDNKYAAGPNGEKRQRNIMRDMLEEEWLPPLDNGEELSFSRTFPVDAIWNMNRVSVIVFVQKESTKEVQQAAVYDFIPQGIIMIDDDESDHPEGFEDTYHELLCKMAKSWDCWVL